MSSLNAVHKGISTHESERPARLGLTRRRRRPAELTSALDESQLSSAFAQLLGARFAPAADGKQPPVALSADEERAPALSRNQLNQLLATFGERGGLLPGQTVSADALSAEGAEGEAPAAGDKPAQPPIAAAKELDAATLQALYAMLPAAIVARRNRPKANARCRWIALTKRLRCSPAMAC